MMEADMPSRTERRTHRPALLGAVRPTHDPARGGRRRPERGGRARHSLLRGRASGSHGRDYPEGEARRRPVDRAAARGCVAGSQSTLTPVFTTDEGVRRNRELMAQFFSAKAKSAKHRHKRVDWELVSDTAEAQRLTRLPEAKELIRGPAGSWHPHRGTTGLLRLALESKSSYCRFYSWAPVARLEQLDGGGWALHCAERGVIRAREVVLATNAYTRHLFPEDMARGEGIPAQ